MIPLSLGTAHKHMEVLSPNSIFSPPVKTFKDLSFFIYLMGKLGPVSPRILWFLFEIQTSKPGREDIRSPLPHSRDPMKNKSLSSLQIIPAYRPWNSHLLVGGLPIPLKENRHQPSLGKASSTLSIIILLCLCQSAFQYYNKLPEVIDLKRGKACLGSQSTAGRACCFHQWYSGCSPR